MDRKKTTLIVTAAAVFALAVAPPSLFDARLEREWKKEDGVTAFLSEPLRTRMEQDPGVLAASVSLVETGSGRRPWSTLLARSHDGDGEIVDDRHGIGRAPIVPAGMMLWPTLTFFIDTGLTAPDTIVSTGDGVSDVSEAEGVVPGPPASGKDSMSVREGLLASSSPLVRRIAIDGDRRWYGYMDRLGGYFGSSAAYWLPKVWDHGLIRPAYASVADGSGIHLSQGQLLTFYDAVANGGMRPRHRYLPKRRICSEQTARVMGALLRENVTAGTGVLLGDNPARIAGEAGVGTLQHGHVPGLYRSVPDGPVETASFVGFFPAEAPRYTMCVTFYYKPQAAPGEESLPMEVFGELATRLMEEEGPWKL